VSNASLSVSLAGLAFLLTLIWGEPLMRVLRHFKIGKLIRAEGPASHQTKMGTPTMGGVLIILPVLLITILMNATALIGIRSQNGTGRSVMLPLVVMVAYGVLGAIDDWQGIRGKRAALGMSEPVKFVMQFLLALGPAWALRYVLEVPELIIPGLAYIVHGSPYWYIPIATFIIIAETNAVNFTDGLDGLAGLIASTCFAAYGVIALLQGQVFLAQFTFTIVGALFGFLWYNVHPAELFMGDTGSMALGATFAVVALMTGQWPLLLLIGVVPLSEVLSVIIQRGYFKLTKGKRFFKMAPIHHHFELLGWSETQVVQRFWLISLLAALIGVGLSVV
jgi:phospho-N-acetylmuramoyl-pentapeptide-transferase